MFLYLCGVRCSPKVPGPRMQCRRQKVPIPFFFGRSEPQIVSSKDSWQAEAQEKRRVGCAGNAKGAVAVVDKRVRCSAGHDVPIRKLCPTLCTALYKLANPVMWSFARRRLLNPTLLLKVANGNVLHGFWSCSISTFSTGSRIGAPWLLTEYDTQLQKARKCLARCRIGVWFRAVQKILYFSVQDLKPSDINCAFSPCFFACTWCMEPSWSVACVTHGT